MWGQFWDCRPYNLLTIVVCMSVLSIVYLQLGTNTTEIGTVVKLVCQHNTYAPGKIILKPICFHKKLHLNIFFEIIFAEFI